MSVGLQWQLMERMVLEHHMGVAVHMVEDTVEGTEVHVVQLEFVAQVPERIAPHVVSGAEAEEEVDCHM